jgi:Domain of unknown function (DUF4398)
MKTQNNPWRRGGITGLHLFTVAAFTVLGVMACASSPSPIGPIEAAKAAVANAVAAEGPELAPAQMRMAREKLDRAKAAMNDKDYPRAQSLAHEAQVDADLATAMAQSTKASKADKAVSEDNRVLREELERKRK